MPRGPSAAGVASTAPVAPLAQPAAFSGQQGPAAHAGLIRSARSRRNNEFSVAASVDEVWTILTDLERIARCLPGAELQEVEGDEHRGIVKVKVGPIRAQYKGKAAFSERDDSGHRAVIRAEGRDTRGNSTAAATITVTLVRGDTGTKVLVVTDLVVTGKVAQFGRGVLADVSSKLMDQFVQSLEADVLNAAAEPGSQPSSWETREIESRPTEPLDLLGPARPSMRVRA